MIEVSIESQSESGPATINVRFDDSASADDLRAAWEDVLNGTLQLHIRDAIRFECARRGIDPRAVVTDPPQSN